MANEEFNKAERRAFELYARINRVTGDTPSISDDWVEIAHKLLDNLEFWIGYAASLEREPKRRNPILRG